MVEYGLAADDRTKISCIYSATFNNELLPYLSWFVVIPGEPDSIANGEYQPRNAELFCDLLVLWRRICSERSYDSRI